MVKKHSISYVKKEERNFFAFLEWLLIARDVFAALCFIDLRK